MRLHRTPPQAARALPSPRALLVFEAAARCGSASAAAREFNLTQPSVSRNVAEVERALGTTLFVRKSSGLELTAEGLLLYRTMSEVLTRLRETVRVIGERNRRTQIVELSLSTAFVTHWFVPRMGAFHAAFPDVDLRFQLTSGALRGPPGDVDLAMRRTDAREQGDGIWPFSPELVLPVCSRVYRDQFGALDAAGTSDGPVLLELTDTEIGWRTMLGSRLADPLRPGSWIELSDYAVVLQMAVSGQGVALGWVSAISRPLADGTLVPASADRIATGRHFSLIAPGGRPLRPIVADIRDWMISEMNADLVTLAPILGTRRDRRGGGRMRPARTRRA